ncbi:putative glutathione-dependent formaldehyde-activating enzyme protein [Naviculisporaceae sp. PSN 640]
MFLRCQCASIFVPLTDPPSENHIPLYICHCTQCRLQSSSLFGTSAIFPARVIFPLSDALKSQLSVWTRPTKQGRSMDCYFCKTCGTRVMHRIREADGVERETVTLKGGCVVLGSEEEIKEGVSRVLDFSRATHLYAGQAVVDLAMWPGARTYEGSPDVMEGRPAPRN